MNKSILLTSILITQAIAIATPSVFGQGINITNDNEKIIFPSLRPGNWDVFYFSNTGVKPRQLTHSLGLDYDAVLSPDGLVQRHERRAGVEIVVSRVGVLTVAASDTDGEERGSHG